MDVHGQLVPGGNFFNFSSMTMDFLVEEDTIPSLELPKSHYACAVLPGHRWLIAGGFCSTRIVENTDGTAFPFHFPGDPCANEVLRSEQFRGNLGVASSSPPWTPVHSSRMEYFESSGTVMHLGGAPNITSNVWHSRDEGSTWVLAARAPWEARYNFASVRMGGDFLISGGLSRFGYVGDFNNRSEAAAFAGRFFGDLWRTADEGATWERLFASAPWGPRAAHALVPVGHGGLLLVYGGTAEGNDVRFDAWRQCPLGSWASAPPGGMRVVGTHDQQTNLPEFRFSCVGCPAGRYGGGDWSVSPDECSPCPLGTESAPGALSAADCTPCRPGYRGGGGQACSPCPPGTFSAQGGNASCSPCPAGTYAPGWNSTRCERCPRGAFCDASGGGNGGGDGAVGDSTPTTCPAGTFSQCEAAASRDSCHPCPGGSSSAAGSVGLWMCETCPRGQYLDLNASRCEGCPPGTYSAVEGISDPAQCLLCPRGSVPSPDSASCDPCPAGTYQPEEGGRECLACPSGRVSQSAGAVSCVLCAPGTVPLGGNGGNATECAVCGPGTAAASGAPRCEACPPGRFAEGEGNSQCQQCPTGTAAPGNGSAECEPCPAGWHGLGRGSASCAACPEGTYNPTPGGTSTAACLACELGTRSGAGASACVACDAGHTTSPPASPDCAPCLPGTYLLAGRCTPCPPGTNSSSLAAEGERACETCPAGTHSASGSAACVPCGSGKYSQVDGATSERACVPCPAGTYGALPGARECEACPSGTFSSAAGLTDASQCERCPAGTYERAGVCIDCPAGTRGNGTGLQDASQCERCAAGSYAPQGSAACSPCPEGTYSSRQAATAQDQCVPCPAGSWSADAAGASSPDACTPCPAGTRGAAGEGATSPNSCEACPAGTYSERGSAACEPCPQGRWSDAERLESVGMCKLCPRGTYGTAQGAFMEELGCSPCPAGTEGRRAGLAGPDQCEPCAPGSVALSEGSASCGPCPEPAHFAPNATACVRCPAWAILAVDGSACDVPCAEGQVPQADARACESCPAGKQRPGGGARGECEPCPTGKSAVSAGTETCAPCAAGTYAAAEGTVQCRQCPESRTTLREGSSSQAQCVCGAGLSERVLDGECMPCPRGADCSVPGSPPRVLPGFWYDPASPMGVSAEFSFTPCLPPEGCRGGAVFRDGVSWRCVLELQQQQQQQQRGGRNASGGSPASCAAGETSLLQAILPPSEVLCADGHVGDRCSSCAPGHFKKSGPCAPCAGTFAATLAVFALVMAAMCAAIYAVSRLRLSLAPLTITVDFFQIVGRQAVINAPWGGGTSRVVQWSSLLDFNIEFAPPECVVDVAYTTKWAFINVLPVAGVALLATFHFWDDIRDALRAVRRRIVGGGRGAPRYGSGSGSGLGAMELPTMVVNPSIPQKVADATDVTPSPSPKAGARTDRVRRLVSGHMGHIGRAIGRSRERGGREFLSQTLLLCQLVYMVLVVKSMEALNCRQLPDGRSVLVASPDILCWEEGGHVALAACGLAATAVYVLGIPLFFAFALAMARREEETARRRAGGAFFWRRAVVPIAGRFRSGRGLWILTIMARKATIASVILMQSSRPIVQLTCTFAVLSAAMAMQMRYRPYTRICVAGDGNGNEEGKGMGGKGSRLKVHPAVRRWLDDANFLEQSTLGAAMCVVGSGLMFMSLNSSGPQDVPIGRVYYTVVDYGSSSVTLASVAYVVCVCAFSAVL